MSDSKERRSGSFWDVALGVVSVILTAAYPFAVYFFNSRGLAALALGFLCVLLGMKTVIARKEKRKQTAALRFLCSFGVARTDFAGRFRLGTYRIQGWKPLLEHNADG